ncbi:MAG: helix-turn-helix transcriptional regulator [Acidobacteriota bacterium]
MQDIPRLSKKERLILDHLIHQGEAFGLELVKASSGELKRGTVYVTLSRMADKGYVESRQVKERDENGPPKRAFRATGHGARVFHAWEMAQTAWVGGLA